MNKVAKIDYIFNSSVQENTVLQKLECFIETNNELCMISVGLYISYLAKNGIDMVVMKWMLKIFACGFGHNGH